MFKSQKYITSAYSVNELPKGNLPEVVLCGRSNVGKSSFINSFFNRKNLAKISSTPGKTRSINYYLIDSNFYIVDLPGYGFAKTSLSERRKWGELINQYFSQSKNIALIIHLIDSRHNPTELDVQFNKMLKDIGSSYIVLLTKSDKLTQSEIVKSKKDIKSFFPELKYNENLFLYSSHTGVGIKEVKKIFSSLFY